MTAPRADIDIKDTGRLFSNDHHEPLSQTFPLNRCSVQVDWNNRLLR